MGIHWSSIHWETLILIHFSCAMLILAVILFVFDWILHKIRHKKTPGLLLRWLLLLPIGITGIYVFFMHCFFPVLSATIMQWPSSPFQYEVALGSLTLGLLGILSFQASYGFRLAAVIAAIIWMWGHTGYLIYQIIITSNIYLEHAVSWFWVDALLPFVLIKQLRQLKSCNPANVTHEPQAIAHHP